MEARASMRDNKEDSGKIVVGGGGQHWLGILVQLISLSVSPVFFIARRVSVSASEF